MTERTASAVWHGDLLSGSGTIAAAPSGAFGPLDVTWASRAEEPDGRTSPEELIAVGVGGVLRDGAGERARQGRHAAGTARDVGRQ